MEVNAQSLHQRIMSDLKRRILSGDWPPGHRIPFEHELATQYKCSRMTVNKVLTQLAQARLIERRRRSGSFVLRPQSQSAVLEIHDIMTEVQALGLPYRFEITRRKKRSGTQADLDLLQIEERTTVLALTCTHFAGHQPFCLEERLIDVTIIPEVVHESFEDLAPGPWLVDRVPWSDAEHRIRAVAASQAAATALKLERSTPCLVVERRTWNNGQAVTHVRFTYPGDGHELRARFTPGEAF